MRKHHIAAAIAATLSLAACGGGGSANDARPETVPHPEGRYDGTTGNGRAATALILGADSYWLFYSAVGNPAVIGGVIQGTIGASSTAGLTSANMRDFNYEGLGTSFGSASASYTPRASLAASILYSTGTTGSFTGAYNATFEQTPSLATIAGAYTGTAATVATGQQAGSATIAADGTYSASASGCNVTGALSPRTGDGARSGGNAYTFTVMFGPAPCFYAGQTFTGVAMYDGDAHALVGAAANASRTDALMFAGTKP